MGKHQQECDYLAIIASQAAEIERLNAQVAQFEYVAARILRNPNELRLTPSEYDELEDAMSPNSPDWLYVHDSNVRDDVLEDCALTADNWSAARRAGNGGNALKNYADAIRAMKGKAK